MTQANTPTVLDQQQYILWDGLLVPVDFPYLNALCKIRVDRDIKIGNTILMEVIYP